MRYILPLFTAAYCVIALLFGLAGAALASFAVGQLWTALMLDEPVTGARRTAAAIESIGLLAVALVAFEISQTVVEEEVVRKAHVSAPTRVRRYLSRFLVVVVVALSIESLVAAVMLLHDAPERLPMAASLAAGAALLLSAWGVFVRLNRSAEDLEPEAIDEARREDDKLR